MARTWPTLNILVYNAIGGSGDELYGVEPASYYVRNLILNMGVCIPSAVLGGAVLVLRLLISGCDRGEAWVNVTVLMCAALWLAVLFSRPHKVSVLLG